MRSFAELTTDQQSRVVDHFLSQLLGAVADGSISFRDADNGDDTQARIEAAAAKAQAAQTPWFVGEIIMEDTVLAERLRGMARSHAENSSYMIEGNNVLIIGVVASVPA